MQTRTKQSTPLAVAEVLPVAAVDRPMLAERTADFKRFSGDDMFALYRPLKTERDGQCSFEAEQAESAARFSGWMREKKPGYSLPEHQLSDAAWTLMKSTQPGEGLLSWTRISVRTPGELGVDRHTAPPAEMAETVKAAARFFGAGLVGIAPMDSSLRQSETGEQGYRFRKRRGPGSHRNEIRNPYEDEMGGGHRDPHGHRLSGACAEGSRRCGYRIGLQPVRLHRGLAGGFIRGLGYQAIPSVNDTAQSVPFAMDAGLGELSRLNKVVMLEFGAAIRLCKVLTDLPMEYDQPVDFGLAAFCRSCKMCAEACPPRALSFDDEPGYEVRGPWNNPGHKAWFEDSYRCLQYWQKVGNGCVSVLQAVRTPKSSKQCKTGSPNLRVVVDESRLTAELCRSTKWLSCGVPSSGSRLCRAPALPYADVEIHCALQVPPMIAGANSRIGRRLGWHNNVQPAATHSRAGSPTIRLEATVVG